jgi:hypothetical protein
MLKSTLVLASLGISWVVGFSQAGNAKAGRDVQGRPGSCKTTSITTVPNYSEANRYFHHGDLKNSFRLEAKNFRVYIGDPMGDTYSWDSVQKCNDGYRILFTNSGSQQMISPPIAALDINAHCVRFKTIVGILQGTYDLAFDFKNNEKAREVPAGDVGKWQIQGGGTFVLTANRISYGSSNMPITEYKIDEIKIDRIDESTLYLVTPVNPAPTPKGFLVKHGDSNTILLLGSTNFDASPAQFIVKS